MRSYISVEEETSGDQTREAYRQMSLECCCDVSGSFCPAHGTYQPVTNDLEIQIAVQEHSRSRPVAHRVIRKHLEK